jgi:hypothetical protein
MSLGAMHKFLACAFAALALSAAGCGGGGGGASSTAAAPNVQAITVDAGPASTTNTLFTSVTVCVPGSAVCRTVDHVLVDTGSTGLRIMASELPASFVLPQLSDGGGDPLVECTQFADGFTWGPVKSADVKIAGEQAAAVPIQVIGDPNYAVIPSGCSSTGPAENTVAAFGANGVLGLGVFMQDCGGVCALSVIPGFYYACPVSGCQETTASLERQVQNPVAMFANDNNGVIVELPAVPDAGAATVNGALVFGIGTQSNNALGAAQVFKVQANTGRFVTDYNNQSYSDSLLDSGSSAYFFADNNIAVCDQNDPYAPGFYCPPSTENLSAAITGTNGANATLDFNVANAHALVQDNPINFAFNNLAAPEVTPGGFIWGLPAFFGRNVYTAIEGQNTSAGLGPYVAF